MTRLPNADELNKLTKPQLADRLDEAYREIERVEGTNPLDVVDDEARAAHHCVRALDRLQRAHRDRLDRQRGMTRVGIGPATDGPVERVICYLQDRFGIDRGDVDGLRARIRDLESELQTARGRLDQVRRASTDDPDLW